MSEPETSRRAVLAAGAAGVTAALTGCAVYGSETAQPPAPATGGSGAPDGGAVLAKVKDLPVGGGKILKEQKVVLTRPDKDTVKAFGIACTHQGCPVTKIADGTINCECHGSRFRIEDGSVAAGPAPKPLPEVPVKVKKGAVRLA
jgi:Rieske Fe-S protein